MTTREIFVQAVLYCLTLMAVGWLLGMERSVITTSVQGASSMAIVLIIVEWTRVRRARR